MKTQVSPERVNLITEHYPESDLFLSGVCLCLFAREKEKIMPQNRFQKMIFALLTVLITVHGYVFYSLYVVNGTYFQSVAEAAGTHGVIQGINIQGGVMMFGKLLPIWAIIVIEFFCAYLLENILGSPLSFNLACRVFNPREIHPVLFETAVICATVGIMCPVMSFLAAWMYYPYYEGFNLWTLLANWLKLVCYNLPFAYFSQLFFIQPTVRTLFKAIFRKQLRQQAH